VRLLILFFSVFLFAANVKSVKKELKNTKITISKMNTRLGKLAKEINKKQQDIQNLEKEIKNLNTQITNLKTQLKNSNQTLNELKDLKKGYLIKLKQIQDKINYFLSTNYYISNQTAQDVNDLINQELTKEILKQYSNKIAKLTNQQAKIKFQIFNVNDKIAQILDKQKLLTQKRNEFLKLKNRLQTELKTLAKKKENYKKRLYSMIKKQQELQKKLKELSIIKTTKHNRVKYTKLPTKIYRGIKTVAPVRGKIIKRFGSYIDPIYKFRVYNDSITIKPYQKNALIRAIMPGRVVYIDRKKGVVVIKHKNYLFSIYANLSKISPILKKGSYVKRGQIIARVADTLEFEITYKDRPINPLKVVKIY
jgi:septal ring factor EnvC (AmiA/AmiB activator)